MVTDQQVRRLMALIPREPTLCLAAAKAGMDEKTARKYRRSGQLPSEVQAPHTWRTRPDPFAEVWGEVVLLLEVNPGLQAKTVFEHLQASVSGSVFGWPVAHVTAPREGVACHSRSSSGGIFPSGALSLRPLPVGFYVSQRPMCDPRWLAFRSFGLPLRADVFQLGDGLHLLLREL